MVLFLEWHCPFTSSLHFSSSPAQRVCIPPSLPPAVLWIGFVPCCFALRLVFAACPFSDIHIHLLSSTHSRDKEVPRTLFRCSPGGPQPQHDVVLNGCPRAGTPAPQGRMELGKSAEGHLYHQCEPSQE